MNSKEQESSFKRIPLMIHFVSLSCNNSRKIMHLRKKFHETRELLFFEFQQTCVKKSVFLLSRGLRSKAKKIIDYVMFLIL